MNGYNLSHSILIQGLDGDLTAGTDGSRVTSLAEVDAKDCESVIFVVQLGTVAASGLFTGFVKGSNVSASYGSGTVGDLGSIVNPTAGEGDDKTIVIEVRRPLQRYLRFDYQRTGGNVTVQSIIAIKVLNRDVRDTEVTKRTILNQPAAATA
ncbi:hypothetical protein CCB80_03235 [Armatimonadetes bacterium Uphvl-Ar1]|nr:hypothetical protein CCB80_03235 [Armatimonadetes bacterium Uphvl-Ar1]